MNYLPNLKLTRPAVALLLVISLMFVSVTSAQPQNQNTDPLPLEDLRNFTEVFERIRSAYVEEVDDSTLFNYAIKGMLSSLDPHSAYLQEEAFSNLQENTSGKFGGLGIEIGLENGLIKVITPIDDTPAERAGIKSGDLIVTLDDEPTIGLSLADAVDRMRGEPGTPIKVGIRRGNDSELLTFNIKRAVVKISSVRGKRLHHDIGYIRITQFQDKTGSELIKIIEDWQNTNPVEGLVLDMRNNPGGVLEAAVDVVNAFISQGTIVFTRGRNPSSRLHYRATEKTVAETLPIVVLINGGSASASEIVAGALQDHQRAIIVGTPSFGKGSVQSVLPLTDTAAVKLTTAHYFTPADRSIQAQGITPDIIIEQSEVTAFTENSFKEADLPGHLNNPSQLSEGELKQRRKNQLDGLELLKNDFQLYEAHTLLRGLSILTLKSVPVTAP